MSDNTYFAVDRAKRKLFGSLASYDPLHPNPGPSRRSTAQGWASARERYQGDQDDPFAIHHNAAPAQPRSSIPMNMKNRNFVRGLFLMAIALLFGLLALNYSIGQLSRSGPGMFPLIVSSLLFLIGALTVVRSHFVEPVPLNYNAKNIAIILLSLVGFAVLSEFINMILGIIFLVFCSTFAGTSYSVVRNIKISVGLIAVAFAFKNFLGLNLPLY